MTRRTGVGFALLILGGALLGFGLATLLAEVHFGETDGWGAVGGGLLLLVAGIGSFYLEGGQFINRPYEVEGLSIDDNAEVVAPLGQQIPRADAAPAAQPTPSPLQMRTDRADDGEATTDRPRVVAIGGGTGMPQLLRGLRAYTSAITAIVTVADDGGSSGRLRRQIGLLPPGDFRNNIAALSESEELMKRLFQYRFPGHKVFEDGSGELVTAQSELAGHSFGNLFIATMAAVTGSFEEGLAESSRILSVRGRVLPSTLEQVHLCAEIRRVRRVDGEVDEEEREEWILIEGESQIPEAGGQIERVFLQPEDVRAYPGAIRALLQADLIVAGPGSFFTSILPNLLVPAVRDAIIASKAPSIYICNVATQPGETDGYSVSDHMAQMRQHAGEAFTTVLANHNYDLSVALAGKSQWVPLPDGIQSRSNEGFIGAGVSGLWIENGLSKYRLFTGDLCEEERPWRHDADKLAARLVEVYKQLQSEAEYTL